MDPERLAHLRRRFGAAAGDDIFDPHFREIARQVFTARGQRKLPYGGVPTLLDAPEQADLAAVDVALIGVPMDLGVTNRPGARFGPRALRAIERIGPYNHQTRVAPLGLCRVADVGDVPFRSRFALETCLQDIETFHARVVEAGTVPLSVGGDHSVSYPILRAIGRGRPVGMVHLDAHCDTAGEFDQSKFHHGGPFRLAVLDGVLDPARTIQIGVRGSAEFLWEFSYESGMTVIHMEELERMGAAAVVARAREVVGTGPVYVSVDVDGFDPAFAPGTGTPEVGGLTAREGLQILRGLMGLDVIGGDVVEVAPQYDPTTNTAQLGAQMLFEILCLAATARRAGG